MEGQRAIDQNHVVHNAPACGGNWLHCHCWDDDASAQVETATAEEIVAWGAEHPAPVIESVIEMKGPVAESKNSETGHRLYQVGMRFAYAWIKQVLPNAPSSLPALRVSADPADPGSYPPCR